MIKTTAQLQQRFVEISENNSFPKNFGTGENLIGLPPNDIYQMGFAAAFFECNRAVNQYVDARTADFISTHAFQPGDPEQGWEKQCSVIAPDGLRHCGGYREHHPMNAEQSLNIRRAVEAVVHHFYRYDNCECGVPVSLHGNLTRDGGNLAECCDCGECESCREVLLQGESV